MDPNTVIEITSVVLNLVFLLLLMRESPWCWIFGITGSGLGVALFLTDEVKLYSEAILYSYYVLVGIYGWVRWVTGKRGGKEGFSIRSWTARPHALALLVGFVTAPALGWLMDHYFHSNNPYLDAHITVFSFIASYMQAEKVISSWYIWILVNAISGVLYYLRGLEIYSGLMVVYFVLSIYGFTEWKKRMNLQDQE